MKKRILTLVIVAMLVIMSALPALAQTGGTLVLTGGSLSIAPQAITFAPYTLDGLKHDNVAGSTTPVWVAKDPTGTGAGWHATIIATTEFTGGITGFQMTLTNAAITCPDGEVCTGTGEKPASSLDAVALNVTTEAATFVTAPTNKGMGTYNLQPTFSLDVPSNIYAGTYTAVVTVAILSTP